MDFLLDQNEVVHNLYTLNETSLAFRNDFGQDGLQSVSDDLVIKCNLYYKAKLDETR